MMRLRYRLPVTVLLLGLGGCSVDGSAVPVVGNPDSSALLEPASSLVIGTFDSRCVAVAFYRSEASLARIDTLYAEYEQAIAAGDSLAAAGLDSLGRDLQTRMHEQVFSAGDADEVLWEIWDQLPAVAEEAGVDLIVSEWDILYSDSLFHPVDVTDILVRRFHPSEETLEIISQMKGMPAVPAQLLSPDA
jgi:hypothetical protein